MWKAILCAAALYGQEPVRTSITVRGEIEAESPTPVAVIPAARLSQTAGVNLDDRLRDIPGFTLFRRSSSLVAHPTTQGVSLRGIGSSGASRTLVLWDGIPINDPFGGWVYWTRIPIDELERVEVARTPSVSAFGDRALGGVLGLYSRQPERWRAGGGYQGGNHNSHEAFAGGSNVWKQWAASANGRAFTSDGYFIVPGEERGAVDRPAAVRFAGGVGRADWFDGGNRVFLRFDLLAESRRNGTPLQTNSTGMGTIAAQYAREGLTVTAYHMREEFRSTFSAIAPDRGSERLTMRQTVPAESAGAAGVWSHRGNGINALAGADIERVEGFSNDVLFPSGSRTGGGRLLRHGVFAQADARVGPVRLFGGLRYTGAFLLPSAGAAAGKGMWRFSGSLYRGFRAPTLNELYREFRAGNAVTLANAGLLPEKLAGGEAAVNITGRQARLTLRGYRNSLEHLITNATLSVSPALIVRQRRNVAAALVQGLEVETRGGRGRWQGEAAYLFVDSRFRSGASVPQVPRNQGSARVSFRGYGAVVSAGVRSYSLQFEDEQNRFLMPGFATAQFTWRQRIRDQLAATLAVENVLDRIYITGFTPAPMVGPGRLWRAGFAWNQ